ncbi:MAG: GntR family transcriptional regulator [Clostridia bacterium]|nr:GntR family transcriptional regulator [Clostridia bacterium]
MPKFFLGKRDVYLEVAERYARFIEIGILKSGDKLPSVRVAASELGVNPNTVQKAYSYLENQGYIYSLPKKGVFVAHAEHSNEMQQHRSDQTRKALEALKADGIGKNEILQILEEVFSDD